MIAATLKTAGYKHVKLEAFEMGKAKYTLAEVHEYHQDLRIEEDRLEAMNKAHKLYKSTEDTIHVMREIFTRMQENIRDHGPRKPESAMERIFGRFNR